MRTCVCMCVCMCVCVSVCEHIESHHALINGQALSRGVHCLKVLQDKVEEGANLVELVIPRLSTRWLLSGVVQVEELQNDFKPAA